MDSAILGERMLYVRLEFLQSLPVRSLHLIDENLFCDISFLRVPLVHIDSRVEISTETPIMVSASKHHNIIFFFPRSAAVMGQRMAQCFC